MSEKNKKGDGSNWSFEVSDKTMTNIPKEPLGGGKNKKKLPKEKPIKLEKRKSVKLKQSSEVHIRKIDSDEEYAMVPDRAKALIIDAVVIAVVVGGLRYVVLNYLINLAVIPDNIAFFIEDNLEILLSAIIYLLYNILPMISSGRTFGKKVAGIQVIHLSGRNVGTITMLLRETVGKVISIISLAGCLMPLFTKKRMALHDYIFRSYVIKL